MEAVLSVGSPQKNLPPPQISSPSNSPISQSNTDLGKTSIFGSARTTPKSQDQISPSFRKNGDASKTKRWNAAKPPSLCSPGLSELHDNCLESGSRYEDIIGQLESPKLSAKMQMIFTSNVNISESIVKNSVKAVDESCIKLENKDLQVELEISELKLHHLEKKLEGCLASSKSTLALNAELSQNVSRIVSPQRSPNQPKARSTSQVNSPTGVDEDIISPKNLQGDLNQLLSDRENLCQEKIKSPNTRHHERVPSLSGLKVKQFPYDNQENIENIFGRSMKTLEKYAGAPLAEKPQNVNIVNIDTNSRRESTQKLRSYFESNNGKQESENKPTESKKNKKQSSSSKPTECTFNNNVTFQTSILEKEPFTESEIPTRGDLQTRESNYSIDDSNRTLGSKANIVVSSRTSSRTIASLFENESKPKKFRREIIFVDEEGKEKTYVIKLKEKLSIQKLETICVDFSKEEKIFFSNQESKSATNFCKRNDWGQLDSIQLRAIEECYSAKDSSDCSSGIMNHKGPDLNSERINIYDNSYIVSLNLDKQEKEKPEQTSVFGQKPKFYEQEQKKETVYKMEDHSFNSMKPHVLNNSESENLINRDEQIVPSTTQMAMNKWENANASTKQIENPESYIKQKITDFRNFLNEFEEVVVSNEQICSPLLRSSAKESKSQQNRNGSVQGRNSADVKNIDFRFENQHYNSPVPEDVFSVQNTAEDEIPTIRVSHKKGNKKPATHKLQYLRDKSPNNTRISSDKMLNSSKDSDIYKLPRNKENSSSFSNHKKTRSSLSKSGLVHSHSGIIKTKALEIFGDINELPGMSLKTPNYNRTHSTLLIGPAPKELNKDSHKNKTLSKSKLLKSTDKIKVDHDLKTKTLPNTQILQNTNIKCRKSSQKNLNEPKVEVVVLTKTPKRTNSLIGK